MSNISQFLGGAPKRILRGTTRVSSTFTVAGNATGTNPEIVYTGIFVDPQKSYIVSSYAGETQTFISERSSLSFGVCNEGSGTAYISTSGEVVVTSGTGSYRRVQGRTFWIDSAANVYWQVVEY